MQHYHTRTHALSMFATHAIVMSLSRIIYFIVPPSTWGQGDVPTDPDRFSKIWWLQLVNNGFYFAGNVGAWAWVALLAPCPRGAADQPCSARLLAALSLHPLLLPLLQASSGATCTSCCCGRRPSA